MLRPRISSSMAVLYHCSLFLNGVVVCLLAFLTFRLLVPVQNSEGEMIAAVVKSPPDIKDVFVPFSGAFRNFLSDIEAQKISTSSPQKSMPSKEPELDLSQNCQGNCNICASSSGRCCKNSFRKEVYLAIMYKSSPRNTKRRQTVRIMWDEMMVIDHFYAEYVLKWQVHFSFVVGRANSGDVVQDRRENEIVEAEADIHRDIIVGDFLESQVNTSAKMLFMLNWLKSNVQFKYLLVINDDSFVNVFNMIHWLTHSPNHNLYTGVLENGNPTMKSISWYREHGFVSPGTFPPYHMGFGFVMSCDAVEAAFEFLPSVPPVGTGDAIMGLLMFLSGVNATTSNRFFPDMRQKAAEGDHALVVGSVNAQLYTLLSKDIMLNYLNIPAPPVKKTKIVHPRPKKVVKPYVIYRKRRIYRAKRRKVTVTTSKIPTKKYSPGRK